MGSIPVHVAGQRAVNLAAYVKDATKGKCTWTLTWTHHGHTYAITALKGPYDVIWKLVTMSKLAGMQNMHADGVYYQKPDELLQTIEDKCASAVYHQGEAWLHIFGQPEEKIL